MFRTRLFIVLGAAFIAGALALLSFSIVHAGPPAGNDLTLAQPDGTAFLARQWGDEWNNGFETVAGYTILQKEDGWWVYATLLGDGTFGPALGVDQELKVGIDDPIGLELHLRPVELISNPHSPAAMLPRGPEAPAYTNYGTQSVLVILVEYTNSLHTYTSTSIANQWFGASSSIKDFYLDASYGKLTLAPATESYSLGGGAANDGVVGWINIGPTHPNPASIGAANQEITRNAIAAADSYINYANYDTNSDGYIAADELHIFVVVAGYEQSWNASTPHVWAHNWNLNDAGLPNDGLVYYDGVWLGDFWHYGGYSQVGEKHGTHQATMGQSAHELGHDLSWPDLYDISGDSAGVGHWSIMGSGSWNPDDGTSSAGTSPSYPDAWLKWYQGWLTPTAINGTRNNVPIPAIEFEPTAYLLRLNTNEVDWEFWDHSGTGQFFLVENREFYGYDDWLNGCGLLIWHIDESVTYTNDANNDRTHPLVDLEQADGADHLYYNSNRGDSNDPYPGYSSHNLNFNAGTNPNSNLYGGSGSGVSVSLVTNGCADTLYANLTAPTFTQNNKRYIPLVMSPSNDWVTIMSENFEGSFPSANWVVFDNNNYPSNIVSPAKRTYRPYQGTGSLWLVGGGSTGSGLASYANYPNNVDAWAMYGPFSTVGATEGELNFKHFTRSDSIAWNDYLCATASDDGTLFYGWCFWGDWWGWSDYTLDLSANNCGNGTYSCLGRSNVWVAFEFWSNASTTYPEGALVDNVLLRKCTGSNCPAMGSAGPSAWGMAASNLLDPFKTLQMFLRQSMQGPGFAVEFVRNR